MRGTRPPLFTVSPSRSKAMAYAPAERADTLPPFLIYPYLYFVKTTKEGALALLGGRKGMSSILADQKRPRIGAQMRGWGDGLRGLSQ